MVSIHYSISSQLTNFPQGPTSPTSTQVNEHPANDKPAVVDKPTISVEPTSKILSRAYEWRWTYDRCDDKPQKQAYNTREQAKAGIPTCNNCLTPKTAGLGKLYILKKRDGPLKPIQSEPTQSGPTQSEPTMNQSEPTQSDPNHSVPQSVPQSEPTQSEATQSKPSQANPTTKVSFNTPSKKSEDTAAVGKSGNVFNDKTPKDSGIILPSRDSAHTTGGTSFLAKVTGQTCSGMEAHPPTLAMKARSPRKSTQCYLVEDILARVLYQDQRGLLVAQRSLVDAMGPRASLSTDPSDI
jgi:hypothetical protein